VVTRKGFCWAPLPTLITPFLIRHRVTIPPPVRARNPVPRGGIDKHRSGAAVHAERPHPRYIVTTRHQRIVDGVRNVGLDVELVEPMLGGYRP
jgi:hypothetical protein